MIISLEQNKIQTKVKTNGTICTFNVVKNALKSYLYNLHFSQYSLLDCCCCNDVSNMICLLFLFLFLQLAHLPLKELYCEENNLLQHIPVHSQQEDEVLTLKVRLRRLYQKLKQLDMPYSVL